MTNRLFAILLTVTFAIAFPLSAKAVLLLGEGGSSCGTWTQLRKTPRDFYPLAAWVLGYLSGVATSTNVDLLRNTDSSAVTAWVDKYCAEHPLDTIYKAAEVLASELATRRTSPPKK